MILKNSAPLSGFPSFFGKVSSCLQVNNFLCLLPASRTLEVQNSVFHFVLSLSLAVQADDVSTYVILLKLCASSVNLSNVYSIRQRLHSKMSVREAFLYFGTQQRTLGNNTFNLSGRLMFS